LIERDRMDPVTGSSAGGAGRGISLQLQAALRDCRPLNEWGADVSDKRTATRMGFALAAVLVRPLSTIGGGGRGTSRPVQTHQGHHGMGVDSYWRRARHASGQYGKLVCIGRAGGRLGDAGDVSKTVLIALREGRASFHRRLGLVLERWRVESHFGM